LYFSTANIYSLQPRTRFQNLFCINETTGHFIWNLTIGPTKPYAIANGYMLATDTDNGVQYCLGKGQTETTVATQQVQGGMLIQGTVMDMSPAQPNTPAISDSDMSEWMNYLQGQNATLINSPPIPHGVPVQLTAVSMDGIVIELGTVTSDSIGHFGYYWNSTSAGYYTVYARFAGSESYWNSDAEASGVIEAIAGPTQSTQQLQLPTDNTSIIIGTGIAIIISVFIAVAIAIIILRKR
jgi:hypothetical protein